jgi:uncharacterized tellurite resistance protein B-like protein
MHEEDMAILKSLAVIAWTDGRVTAEEHEHLEALISAFGATETEAKQVRDYAAVPRSMEDIPLTDLSAGDRRTLLNHAVVLSFVDGHQADKEKEMINALVGKLHIPQEEATRIIDAAEARVKRLLEISQ